MQQVENIEEIFKEYFKTNHPSQIIELGYGSGEFTNIIYTLRSEYPYSFQMITFDNKVYSGDLHENIIFCRADIFNSLPFIASLIRENTLILCDNGHKITEVRQLIPHLKKGCVIMAHDYGEQRFWDYREIYDKDIEDLVFNYGLKSHMQDLMIKGAWLSLIKK
jgi:hypothetical protein